MGARAGRGSVRPAGCARRWTVGACGGGYSTKGAVQTWIGDPAMATNDIQHLLTSLADTPRRLTSIRRSVDDERLHDKPDANIWSAHEILVHLRACADVWGKSILMMIAQDHPTIRYISPRTVMRRATYRNEHFHESLQAFSEQRIELLAALTDLPSADWSRGATFTATTRGHEQTIVSYVRRIAEHEIEHCEQLEVLLSVNLRRLPPM